MTVERVAIADTAAVSAAVVGADMLWIESPTNPAMEVADLPALAAAGRAAGATVVVDNTFATPLLQQPLSMGADIVLHSATKFIAGHSDVVLGAVITDSDELWASAGVAAQEPRRDPWADGGLPSCTRAADAGTAAGASAVQRSLPGCEVWWSTRA